MPDLQPGDFLYQSDQELFLVVTAENEDSYEFAAHGWREIGKDRLEEYIDDSRSRVYRQDEAEEIIKLEGDNSTSQSFNKLKQLFKAYEDSDFAGGPQEDFTIEDK